MLYVSVWIRSQLHFHLPDASIKLIDFGLSSIEPTSTELVGSPAFVAPEIAIGFINDGDLDKPYDSKVRTLMSDMCLHFPDHFSCACVKDNTFSCDISNPTKSDFLNHHRWMYGV